MRSRLLFETTHDPKKRAQIVGGPNKSNFFKVSDHWAAPAHLTAHVAKLAQSSAAHAARLPPSRANNDASSHSPSGKLTTNANDQGGQIPAYQPAATLSATKR